MQYLKNNYTKNIQHETLLKITTVALLLYDFFWFFTDLHSNISAKYGQGCSHEVMLNYKEDVYLTVI